MANMGYCRFQNTAGDLEECYDHWDDEVGEEEEAARERILCMAKDIVADYGDDDD